MTFYALNSVIYIGKSTITPDANLTAKAVTLHLPKLNYKTGRHLKSKAPTQKKENIVHLKVSSKLTAFSGDNWFSSLELAQSLTEQCITYIGTIRKNSRAVPPTARSIAGRLRKDT